MYERRCLQIADSGVFELGSVNSFAQIGLQTLG